MKEVRWSKLADGDLERIARWYRDIDSDLASRMVERITAATGLLRDHPMAAAVELYGTRRKRRAAGTPYNLLYRVGGDHVRILRVVHHAQDQRRR